MTRLADRITVNPKQCDGRPCVRGMRIRASDVRRRSSAKTTISSSSTRTSKKILTAGLPKALAMIQRGEPAVRAKDVEAGGLAEQGDGDRREKTARLIATTLDTQGEKDAAHTVRTNSLDQGDRQSLGWSDIGACIERSAT
jgi:hypothetical protein